MQDLLPGIINQLGQENLDDLKKIYANYADPSMGGGGDDSDDEVPELVENFEQAAAGGGDDDDIPDLVAS